MENERTVRILLRPEKSMDEMEKALMMQTFHPMNHNVEDQVELGIGEVPSGFGLLQMR